MSRGVKATHLPSDPLGEPGMLQGRIWPASKDGLAGPDREIDLGSLLPSYWQDLENPQQALPRLAKDSRARAQIESLLAEIPTHHDLFLGDAREVVAKLPSGSVDLVLTSPPYWSLKEYPKTKGQLGWVEDYEDFLSQLAPVWESCFRVLVPGGRLVCVVGDVCLSRRRNRGRHTVVPLHASIQEQCRHIGFDNLAPIIWYKIANAKREVENGRGSFLGKPYEPNSILKNDIEYILMQRKPGGYRRPSLAARVLSVIPKELHGVWFRQLWNGPGGASTRNHPAPYPVEIAERLIRMFSFAGDTVLDPFMGTATTQVAAGSWGRNSIGVEIEPSYLDAAVNRLAHEANVIVHR